MNEIESIIIGIMVIWCFFIIALVFWAVGFGMGEDGGPLCMDL